MNDRGFSLAEVLVAMFVVSIIAVAGTAILSNTVRGQSSVVEAHDRMQSLQVAHSLIRDDLSQIVQRAAGHSLNRSPIAVFDGRQPGTNLPMVQFVRGGWSNPELASQRSTLQAIDYRIDDGQLIRIASAFVDKSAATPTTETVLLRDVDQVRMGYRDGNNWLQTWVGALANEEISAPRAIRFEFEFADGEKLTWLFASSRSD